MKNFTILLISVILIIGIICCQPQEVTKDYDLTVKIKAEDTRTEAEAVVVSVTQQEKDVVGLSNELDIDILTENELNDVVVDTTGEYAGEYYTFGEIAIFAVYKYYTN